VTLSAGDREAAGVENRRDVKAGRDPERNAFLARGHRFDAPAQRAIDGDQTGRGREGREHQGLDEQLTDDSRAACTERRTYGHFALADRRAGVEKGADGRACQEQHQQ
jgi:hypothetical protein